MLVRAYELAAGPLPRFLDEFAVDDGSEHEPTIDKAAHAGLASGLSPSAFDPSGQVRRDQMASFLSRVTDRLFLDGSMELPG